MPEDKELEALRRKLQVLKARNQQIEWELKKFGKKIEKFLEERNKNPPPK